MMKLRVLSSFCFCLFISGPALAQKRFELGGFLEGSAQVYPSAPNSSDAHAAGSGRFQLWSRAKLSSRISWRGRVDFRIDTHLDADRNSWADLSQRGLRQPAGALSEFYLDLKLGRLDLRAGKQEIRWGRADGFNPTDNLVPYDYLDTFSDERIPAPAVKADAYLARAHFEAVWLPYYTPTRLPLLGQRWFPRLPAAVQAPSAPGAPPSAIELSYRDAGGTFPARTLGNGQWGLRWNQIIPRAEFSISYFDGFDDLPFFRGSLPPGPPFLVSLKREYYRLRAIGADFASELGAFGIRGETAWFDQTDPQNRDHLIFIAGIDRSFGDWFAIAQFAGQHLSRPLDASVVFPDLGLRSTLICRLERTLGPSRSFEIKGALRLRDGDFYLQPLYSVAMSNNWRLKVGATLFGGPRDGYLGQFRDNSRLNLQLRYTF